MNNHTPNTSTSQDIYYTDAYIDHVCNYGQSWRYHNDYDAMLAELNSVNKELNRGGKEIFKLCLHVIRSLAYDSGYSDGTSNNQYRVPSKFNGFGNGVHVYQAFSNDIWFLYIHPPDPSVSYKIMRQKQSHQFYNWPDIYMRYSTVFCNTIKQLIPEVKIGDWYTYCQSGIHKYTYIDGFIANLEIEQAYCRWNGERFICPDCETKLSLNEPVQELPETNVSTSSKAKQRAIERAKMTPALRFKILERDSFKCRACGASPRDDDDVVLHVDHIHPIAHGGKTEEDNLQVLCKSCNMAKGANIVEQMSLWD